MKVCEKEYPKGYSKYQKSDGFYMDKNLLRNLDYCAEAITNDMDFVFLVTGSGFVRVGKSVMAMQCAKYLTNKVNELNNFNIPFNFDNMVWNSENLMKNAMKLPKYSSVILDEGDDLAENYWNYLAKILRRFFRKCGQRNLFIFLILPDFFELPIPYAISRSIALINVKFYGAFKRGLFDFYGFEAKKRFYIKGKRYRDYTSHPPDFSGQFSNFYVLNEAEYRKKKYEDMIADEKKQKQLIDRVIELRLRKKWAIQTLDKFHKIIPPLSQGQLSQAIGVVKKSIQRYDAEIKKREEEEEEEEELFSRSLENTAFK